MPHDLYIDENRSVTTDETGDLQTVSGDDAVLQSIAMSVTKDNRLLAGEPLSETDVENFRSAVERAVRDNEFVDGPVDVRVTARSLESIDLEIRTASRSLSLSTA